MSKPYKPYQPEQDLLLPPSLKDWLPEKHLAYFVSEVVDELDPSGIYAVYEKDTRGQPPYDPRMMTKLFVYGYCVGVYSARKIRQRLTEDIAFRMLAASEGHQDVVELLLSNRAKVDAEDEYSYTPLHWVAIKGHSDMAGLLLANNAGVNAIAKDGETPLHEAATAGHKDVAELLLAHAVKHVKKRDERREMIDKDLRLEA